MATTVATRVAALLSKSRRRQRGSAQGVTPPNQNGMSLVAATNGRRVILSTSSLLLLLLLLSTTTTTTQAFVLVKNNHNPTQPSVNTIICSRIWPNSNLLKATSSNQDYRENDLIDNDDEECRIAFDNNNNKNRQKVKGMLQDEIDLERARARLGSYDLYVIVSVLTAATSFEVVKSAANQHLKQEAAAMAAAAVTDMATTAATTTTTTTLEPPIVLVAGLASLCGLHSTAIWSLCALYGRSALGLQRDGAFSILRGDLAEIRNRGFFTFSASLLLFSLEVCLLLLRDTPRQLQWPVGLLALTALYYIMTDWKSIYDKAAILFSGEPVPTRQALVEDDVVVGASAGDTTKENEKRRDTTRPE